MQVWAERFYNSKQWKHCREAYKKLVHYQCENCGGAGEIVHHRTPLTRENIHDPHVTLCFQNLQLLCRKCHGAAHGDSVTEENYFFDADGNLQHSPPLPKDGGGK